MQHLFLYPIHVLNKFSSAEKMKGIVLAGGSGSRLAPLTNTTSKQLLPVYDKPMVYYPLATLMDLGIKDVLIISTPRDLPNIEALFGDGKQFGLTITYRVQSAPNGIAECFLLADDFIDEPICLILGDNIFILREELLQLRRFVQEPLETAAILLCPVQDPERFGVANCGENGRVLKLEEKPRTPTSNLASVGLYFYPADVLDKARQLKPSARGELEITDLNNIYLQENRLNALRMTESSLWLDAGTPDSLLQASVEVEREIREHGNPVGYLEVLALRRGLISETSFEALVTSLKPGTPYREKLRQLAFGRDA